MPPPISFAWTYPPLICGAKTVTRRAWAPRHVARYHEGDEVAALDRLARAGGRLVGRIRLVQTPYLQSTAEMPDADYVAEGFAFLEQHPFYRPRRIFGRLTEPDEFAFDGGWRRWKERAEVMYVVRFELIERMVAVDCDRTER